MNIAIPWATERKPVAALMAVTLQAITALLLLNLVNWRQGALLFGGPQHWG